MIIFSCSNTKGDKFMIGLRKNKRAGSLVVLVITIIVMIILAMVIIISLTSGDIINKANTAVKETNLSQVKQIAHDIWSQVYLGPRVDDFEQEVIDRLEAALGYGEDESIEDDYDVEISQDGIEIVERIPLAIPEGGT